MSVSSNTLSALAGARYETTPYAKPGSERDNTVTQDIERLCSQYERNDRIGQDKIAAKLLTLLADDFGAIASQFPKTERADILGECRSALAHVLVGKWRCKKGVAQRTCINYCAHKLALNWMNRRSPSARANCINILDDGTPAPPLSAEDMAPRERGHSLYGSSANESGAELSPDSDSAVPFADAELLILIGQATADLSSEQREVFRLHALEGLDIREAAERASMTKSTAHRVIQKVRDRLAVMLSLGKEDCGCSDGTNTR